jgi:hypothetical protein
MQIGDLVVTTPSGIGHEIRVGIIVAKGRHSDPYSAYWDVLFPDGVSCLNEWGLKRLKVADAKG